MQEWFKRLVMRALRVPPEPGPPLGSKESVRIFRAAGNYYRYRLFQWGLKQAGAAVGIVLVLTLPWADRIPWQSFPLVDRVATRVLELRGEEKQDEEEKAHEIEAMADNAFFYLEMVGLALLLLQIPFTYMMVRIDFEMRWYIMTDRSLRIREGVTRIREMTMTFANIQNLSIEQGPLQRLLRISDLRVRTAGGGSGEESQGGEGKHDSSQSMHIGYFRGVDGADVIRDEVLLRLRQLRGAGLGDPDDDEYAVAQDSPGARATEEIVEAARALLDESRALRRSVEGAEPV